MNVSLNQTNPTFDIDRELDSLYSSLKNRPAFNYRPAADPLYRSYAESYTQKGKMAMADSAAQAAHLTGGYGSSYSQRVAQEQYNRYLRSLGEVLPELYGMAESRYRSETQSLQNLYDMNFQRREAEYQHERDAAEDKLRQDELSYKQKQNAYDDLLALISATGYSPTESELEAAGLTKAQAEALINRYLMENGLLKTGGGSGGGYYGEGYGRQLVSAPVSKGSPKQSTGGKSIQSRPLQSGKTTKPYKEK